MTNENIYNLKGLSQIASLYEAFILGFWGVITESETASLPGFFETIVKLYQQGKKIVILSNSAKSSAQIRTTLTSFGISRKMYTGILTAGDVLYSNLNKPLLPFFASLGNKCLPLTNNKQDWYLSDHYQKVFNAKEADFLLLNSHTFPNNYIENYISLLKEASTRKLPLIAIKGEDFYYNGRYALLGSGSIVKEYQKMSGEVVSFGKPDKEMLSYCLSGLGNPNRKKVLFIGDTLTSDIKNATELGLDSLLICGGKHSRELDLYRGEPIDINALDELCRVYGLFPTYAMTNLQWTEH